MKREKRIAVPFAVMRQIGTSMEDQLVSGFTRVIRSGMYADGTALPGIRKLAVMFGVSEITVRNAVKRLCRDGLLAARPRVGLTVCAPGGRSWRGAVLGVKAGPPGMYFANVMESEIGKVLRRAGWLYSSVSVLPESLQEDLEMVDLLLKSPISLVVTFNAMPAVSTLLEQAEVPFVEVSPHKRSAKASFVVRDDVSRALFDLAVRLKASGVKTVLSAYQHPSVSRYYADALEKEGLKVRPLWVKPLGGHNTQECVQRAGLLMFDTILSSNGLSEDAIVCNDDYLAAGILSAFDRHGVQMPEDVKFATLANKGLGPVHVKELTRIEYDPVRAGRAIAERMLVYLEKREQGECVVPFAEFRAGDTV